MAPPAPGPAAPLKEALEAERPGCTKTKVLRLNDCRRSDAATGTSSYWTRQALARRAGTPSRRPVPGACCLATWDPGLLEFCLRNGRLEELDRIAGRILQKDLLAAYAGDDLVAESGAARA